MKVTRIIVFCLNRDCQFISIKSERGELSIRIGNLFQKQLRGETPTYSPVQRNRKYTWKNKHPKQVRN